VVVLAIYGGAGGGYGRQLGLGGREREREMTKLGERRLHLFFFTFCTRIFHAQAMESIHIYRGWKREVLSLMVKILALGYARKDLNCWFKIRTMNCQICQLKTA
jgi:hypothetical protein